MMMYSTSQKGAEFGKGGGVKMIDNLGYGFQVKARLVPMQL